MGRSGKIQKVVHGNLNEHKRNVRMLQSASMESAQSVSTTSENVDDPDTFNRFIEFDSKNHWNIEIELIPYPNELDNQKSISVRTLRECTVQHLADCLQTHLGTKQKIVFFINNGKGFIDVDLDDELSDLVSQQF